VPGG